MNHKLKTLAIYMICTGAMMLSCTLESPDNGDLDGFWQLKQADTLATGRSSDLRSSGLSWAFQGNILELRNTTDINKDYLMRFSRRGDSLIVSSPYIIKRDSGDIPLASATLLQPFGIHQTQDTLFIRHLDGDAMTLESALLRLHLRKY